MRRGKADKGMMWRLSVPSMLASCQSSGFMCRCGTNSDRLFFFPSLRQTGPYAGEQRPRPNNRAVYGLRAQLICSAGESHVLHSTCTFLPRVRTFNGFGILLPFRLSRSLLSVTLRVFLQNILLFEGVVSTSGVSPLGDEGWTMSPPQTIVLINQNAGILFHT